MQNIKDLRDSLISNFEKIQSKEISIKEAKELTNLSGKIIGTIKTELEYNKMIDQSKKIIKFMQYEE